MKEGLKCEGRVDHSPAGNQGKAGDESWGVLALLLSCSILSLCSLFLCTALLSDCHKASARPLSKTNPFPPYPPFLSLVYLAMLDSHLQVFSFLFVASCSFELCGVTITMQSSEAACGRRVSYENLFCDVQYTLERSCSAAATWEMDKQDKNLL